MRETYICRPNETRIFSSLGVYGTSVLRAFFFFLTNASLLGPDWLKKKREKNETYSTLRVVEMLPHKVTLFCDWSIGKVD